MTESSFFDSTIFMSPFFALNTNNLVIIPNYRSCLISIFATDDLQGPEPTATHSLTWARRICSIFGFKQIIRILLHNYFAATRDPAGVARF